jgi:hypothetical protein
MERTVICKMIFGSKLYGTDTPESDTDYKSIFMPTTKEILTGEIPKSITTTTGNDCSRNHAEDVDHESFSLHYFMKLLYQGQTVALDMLHAPADKVIETSPIWRVLTLNRRSFYTKNMRAFVGYARKQAAKYGVKGSRLDAAREALAFLMTKGDRTIFDLWGHGELWEGEHIHLHLASEYGEGELDKQQSYWEVCGKRMTFGGKASYYVPMMKKFYDNYGARAKLAASNQGIDWKAISHAFRVAFQTKAILSGNGFSYPLCETPFLKNIKNGDLDYLRIVAPALDELMMEIDELSQQSTLPEKVDVSLWQHRLAIYTQEHLRDNPLQ